MVLEGKLWKAGRQWLIEVAALDVMTQGTSKRNALRMIKEAIELLVNARGFRIQVRSCKDDLFYVEANRPDLLLALVLKRQRAKHHLSLSDMAERLGVKSKNSYAQYEQGKSQPSLSKVQEFLAAMSRQAVLALNVIE